MIQFGPQFGSTKKQVKRTAYNSSYLQCLGEEYVQSFIFAIAFGHGGQRPLQIPATANSQTLAYTA